MFIDTSLDTRTREKITQLRDKAKSVIETYRAIEKRLPDEVSLWESINWLQNAVAELEYQTDFFKKPGVGTLLSR